MSHPQWQQSCGEKVCLLGVIDRDSVPSLWQFIQRWQATGATMDISLEHVERIDSAGMVMLIHLIEHAKKQNCHIMLSFVPEQLNTLIQLSNIKEFLAGHIQSI
ncbi:STAS domain-containing protein [Vibrio sp. TRT 21S02]|uniref:STAS domain-containing protein n=1 Tax=Vibrio sp. TRT 21S02 TaxID=3418507 RepID=UPI003CF4BD0B